MLQQTQVVTVIPYFRKFLRRFPDIVLLADADLNQVLKTWEGLGYYARARNLHKASKIIVARYGGCVPEDVDLFRHLPGVGDYISSAVLSIAYEQPFAVVDGNVKRVLSRFEKQDSPVNEPRFHKQFKNIADILLDKENPGDHNQAMMELGAMVCTPQNPKCTLCPINDDCRALHANVVKQFPRKIKKARVPHFNISTGVVCKGNKILITRRQSDGLLGGLWEFPGGKVKKGENAEAACVREIREEVNLEVKVLEHLIRIRHAYTHFKISMDVYICKYLSGRVRLNGPEDFRWISFRNLDNFPLPRANHKFLEPLKKWFVINGMAH